jgi:hypothetical protein
MGGMGRDSRAGVMHSLCCSGASYEMHSLAARTALFVMSAVRGGGGGVG